MIVLDSLTIFNMLLEIMSEDNGFGFTATEMQVSRGQAGIELMRAFGVKFPLSEANNLNGIFWTLAAGDEDVMLRKYGNVPGFRTLHKVLNEIFNVMDQ